MRVEHTYYAFDDTEFSTEEECVKYEEAIKSDMKSCVFLDKEYNRLSVEDNGIESMAENAWYIKVRSADEAKKLFVYFDRMFGFNMPEQPKTDHYYRYDEDGEKWIDMNRESDEVQKRMLLVIEHTKEEKR